MVEVQKLKYQNDLEIAKFYIKTNRKIAAFKRLILIKQSYGDFSFYSEKNIDKLYDDTLKDISNFSTDKKQK